VTDTGARLASIRPVPDEEEAAAIVAAVEATWPRGAGPSEAPIERWRWSGRWWTKPVPLRRRRPW